MFEALCMMMQDKHVTDEGYGLVKLASEEWFFCSRFAGTLAGMFTDTHTRVNAMALLMPRVVDLNNWGKQVMTKLDDDECKALEMKVGELFFFSPSNPTGHYKLELANPHQVRKDKRFSFAMRVYTPNDHFTKTGSGQT